MTKETLEELMIGIIFLAVTFFIMIKIQKRSEKRNAWKHLALNNHSILDDYSKLGF